MENKPVKNVLCVGIGGQGVLTVSEILAVAAFHDGLDVKKSEVHGMSQRGGSVTSAVRFGREVHAPLIPEGEVDLLLGFDPNETVRSRHLLREGGVVIEPTPSLVEACLSLPRTLNTAVLGLASLSLPISEASWDQAIAECVPPHTIEINRKAFRKGREEV